MRGSDYAELVAFVAVVDCGSFARAADQLRIAPSSLSQTIKKLERRLGVALLYRNTRNVAATASGLRLYHRFKPAMVEMAAAVTELHQLAARPAGDVRLHMPRPAYGTLLGGRLGEFRHRYPELNLDLTIDDAVVDLMEDGYDLDVRLSRALDPTLSAIAIGPAVRHVAIASPAYLREFGAPATPHDLRNHRCIQWRRANAKHVQPWVFEIDGALSMIDVAGPLTVSHCAVAVEAAAASFGVALVLDNHARTALASGEVTELLASYLPYFPGWHACYARSPRFSPANEAVIGFLKAAPLMVDPVGQADHRNL
jgi:DNA-binding transcriptional LysR family regulator